ncbi:MAG: ABC transporter permease [Epsilonproteobacteria bacterium]|nr:ABC transporter permease [Campylobacterota bacterium]
MAFLEQFFSFLGKRFLNFTKLFTGFGHFWIFQVQLFPLYFKRPLRLKELLKQMEIVGIGSVGVIVLTGTFTGLVSAVQLYQAFHQFGAQNMMGYPIFISIARELGPVFAGLMLTSRAISAMAAELGTMRVTEQIDAIDTLAVDSKKYLLIPRILATTLSLPLLVILFDFLGNFSAYLISVYALGINETAFLNTIHMYLKLSDILTGVLKGFIFGFFIGMIGTYIGYHARGGARGVGMATTSAVVYAAIVVFVMDYFLSSLFLIIGW